MMSNSYNFGEELFCLLNSYEETDSYIEWRMMVDLHGIELTDKIIEVFIKTICGQIIIKERRSKSISFVSDFLDDTEMNDGSIIIDHIIKFVCSKIVTNKYNDLMPLFKKLLNMKPTTTIKEYKYQKTFLKYSI